MKTLSEEAYMLLKRDILSGRCPPGTKLQFKKLAEQYEFGVAPLREALMTLASERLVTFAGQKGFAVAQISRTELHDVGGLWRELSVAALGLSIDNGDPNWEADVVAALHRLSHAPLPASSTDYETAAKWEYLHDSFHMSLIAACESPWRLHFCYVLSAQFERYRRVILVQMGRSIPTARKIDEEHRAIANAAIIRDKTLAMQLLWNHFTGSIDYLDEHFETTSPDRTLL